MSDKCGDGDSRKWPQFLALHLGAGCHSKDNIPQYLSLCKKTCERVRRLVGEGEMDGVDVVSKVLELLEDSEVTNAGYGSNLTRTGWVEGEAAIQTPSHYGAVGAVRGVRHPSHIARLLVRGQEEQWEKKGVGGLVDPMCLVGEGAVQWARERGVEVGGDEELVTQTTLQRHRKIQAKLRRDKVGEDEDKVKRSRVRRDKEGEDEDKVTRSRVRRDKEGEDEDRVKRSSVRRDKVGEDEDKVTRSRARRDKVHGDKDEDEISDTDSIIHMESDKGDVQLDTVGVIWVDRAGHIYSGSSSGGIHHKHPGRLGQTTMYGSGVWSEVRGEVGVGVVTTGCGEHITKCMMGKESAAVLLDSDAEPSMLVKWFEDKFVKSPSLSHVQQKMAGLLAVRLNKDEERLECIWVHTTPTMIISYMGKEEIKSFVSHNQHPNGGVGVIPSLGCVNIRK